MTIKSKLSHAKHIFMNDMGPKAQMVLGFSLLAMASGVGYLLSGKLAQGATLISAGSSGLCFAFGTNVDEDGSRLLAAGSVSALVGAIASSTIHDGATDSIIAGGLAVLGIVEGSFVPLKAHDELLWTKEQFRDKFDKPLRLAERPLRLLKQVHQKVTNPESNNG